MLVVNLYGGPGTGKSTTAAATFAVLKGQGVRCELVTEVAKDLTYERSPLLANSLHVLSEQYRRLDRLRGEVDVVISDSPLLLAPIYADGVFAEPWFSDGCLALHEADPSLNVMLRRAKPYASYGRTQTEEEARAIDARLRRELPIPFDLELAADCWAAPAIAGAARGRLTRT